MKLTLIELFIIIVIGSLISAIAVPACLSAFNKNHPVQEHVATPWKNLGNPSVSSSSGTLLRTIDPDTGDTIYVMVGYGFFVVPAHEKGK